MPVRRGHLDLASTGLHQVFDDGQAPLSAVVVGHQHPAGRPHVATEHVPRRVDEVRPGVKHPCRVRLAAGGDHDHLGRLQPDIVGVDRGGKTDINAGPVHLVDQPVDQPGHLLLPLGGPGHQRQLATEPTASFEQNHVVAPFGCHPGRLQAGRAAAHHHDPPGRPLPTDHQLGHRRLPTGGRVLYAH